MSQSLSIDGRPIGPDHPPYVIAEMSGNHNGDIGRALKIMAAAKEAGADAIKLQTYTPDTITIRCDKPDFLIKGGLWNGRMLYDLYAEAHTPWDWHERLFEEARRLSITVFSTPFDPTSVDLLERLGAPAYKVASFEIVDLPLIERIARTGKPMIISTGMADEAEISDALATARKAGCHNIILLHCVSGYPTPVEDANLNTIPNMAARFDTPIGLSDHTPGIAAAVTSIALGARVIEKHFTLARADGGPDAAFSLEPTELADLCRSARAAWLALGKVDYSLKSSERNNMVFRRSLYAVSDIARGEKFTNDNVRSIRPGYGLPPKHLPDILGRRATKSIERGTPMSLDLIGKPNE